MLGLTAGLDLILHRQKCCWTNLYSSTGNTSS